MLNEIYKPICAHTQNFLKALKTAGYSFERGFYNNHSVKAGGEWLTEYYAIPVVTVKDVCDVGFDIEHTFVECKLTREKAVVFDFGVFSDNDFEVYGTEDFLNDFYNSLLSLETLNQKIRQSAEKEIGITFNFGYLADTQILLELIKKLERIGTHIL